MIGIFCEKRFFVDVISYLKLVHKEQNKNGNFFKKIRLEQILSGFS